MPKQDITIENQVVRLRLLGQEDLPLTLSWRNNPEIRKWFMDSRILEVEQHYKWFASYRDKDDDFVFVIESKELDGLAVGQIAIYDIDWTAMRAEFGRLLIGETVARGKGIAKTATRLLLSHCFEVLKLSEVFLEVKPQNVSAISVYKAVGFVEKKRTDRMIEMLINSDLLI